jgi:tetratricopeptide (TPR) repeat protein
MRLHTEEVENWLAQLLERYNDPDSLRVQALAVYAGVLGNWTQAQKIINQGLELSHAISDKAGEALSLWFLGVVISLQGNYSEGLQIVEQSLALFQLLGDKLGQAQAMGWLSQKLNDLKRSKVLVSESLRLYRELGHLFGIAECLRELALRIIWEGDFYLSVPLLEEAHMIYRQLGNKSGETEILGCQGTLAYWKGDYQQAYAYQKESFELHEIFGNYYLASWAGVNMAYALMRQGRISKATEVFQLWLQRSYQSKDIDLVIYTLEGLASLYVNQVQFERATQLFAWTNMMRVNMDNQNPPIEQASIEKDLAVIHSKVNDTQFAELFAKGRALTTEQAVAFALNELQ